MPLKIAVIDKGNTLTKLYFIEKDTISWGFFSRSNVAIKRILEKSPPEVLIWTSVVKNKTLLKELQKNFPEIFFYEVSSTHKGLLKNSYKSPETLGTDRWCAVNGAYYLFQKPPFLVIDFGTAITTDVVNRQGQYLGGSIAPGIYLRFRALNDYTSRLPLIKFQGNVPLIGENTEQSVASGVVNGVLAEYECLIKRYKKLLGEDLTVFLTGGDAPFFEFSLKNANFGNSFLVPLGAYAIYRKNNSI